MGGGNGAYTAYAIPVKMATNENGTYAATPAASTVSILATSRQQTTNTITVTVDSDGKLGSWTYVGDFQ
jgi:hypothetical protein